MGIGFVAFLVRFSPHFISDFDRSGVLDGHQEDGRDLCVQIVEKLIYIFLMKYV